VAVEAAAAGDDDPPAVVPAAACVALDELDELAELEHAASTAHAAAPLTMAIDRALRLALLMMVIPSSGGW